MCLVRDVIPGLFATWILWAILNSVDVSLPWFIYLVICVVITIPVCHEDGDLAEEIWDLGDLIYNRIYYYVLWEEEDE